MKHGKVFTVIAAVPLLLVGWLVGMHQGFVRPRHLLQKHWSDRKDTQWIGNENRSLKGVTPPQEKLHKALEQQRVGSFVTPMLHQSWKSRKLPTKRAERWRASWGSCFPHWERRLWTDEDNLELVRDHYPWFLPVYLSFKKPVERADLARYFYMFHFGGVYADLDAICLKNFNHLLNSTAMLFGGMDGLQDGEQVLHTYVQNSFMASRPGHPFWIRLISRVMMYRHLGKKGRAEFTTGPYVLMDELRDYMRQKPRDTKIYTGKYFNPFSWFRNKVAACKDLGRMTDAEEAKCIAAFPDAYVVQLHTQIWLHGKL